MGSTVDEVLAHAEEALADWVKMLEEEGKVVPDPSVVEELDLEPGEMVAYVNLVQKPMVPVKAAAAELGVSDARVRQLCLSDLIVGAERFGKDWVIPSPVVRRVVSRGRPKSAIVDDSD